MRTVNKAPKIPRSNSALKNLPDERQAKLEEYYCAHKGTDTVKWLETLGIETNPKSVSRWYAWYQQMGIYEGRQTKILKHLANLKRRHPELTNEILDEMGEFLFNAWAIEEKDIKTWNYAQQIRLKRQRQAQQGEMVKIARKKQELELQKYKDKKAKTPKEKDNTGMTPTEKDQRMKEILRIN